MMNETTKACPIETRLRDRILAPRNFWIGSIGISPEEADGFQGLVAEVRRFVNEGHCADVGSPEDEPCYSPGLDDGGTVTVQWCHYGRLRVALGELDTANPVPGEQGYVSEEVPA